MIFQWQLFILLIGIAVLAPVLGQCYEVKVYGSREIRYGWLPVLALTIPLIYLAGTRVNYLLNFGDTSTYLIGFKDSPISVSAVINNVTKNTKDIGFSVITAILKGLVGGRAVVYFTIIAAVCLICVMYAYKRYSCSFIISAFLFIASADYLQWTYNGIRQFIPVAILFACAGLIVKKKYVPLIILILLLSSIHATALLMLPIIFIVQGKPFNKKTILFILVMLLAIAFINQFTDIIVNIMENTQYRGEIDQFINTEGTSIQRVLVYSLPAFCAILFRKRIEAADNPLINIATNMSIVTVGLFILSAFSSGLLLGRLSIYTSLYNYILLPWEIENAFTKKTAKLIYCALIICYLFYYYYQVEIIWGL